ncbi:MAG: hypothetical protein ACREYE_01915 [Gammaproteobacteria bacterium]
MKNKINEAVLDVMLLVEPPEFQSTTPIATVANTSAYSLQATDDVLAILGVRNSTTSVRSNRRLIRGSYEEFDEQDQNTAIAGVTGTPTKYFRYANQIILYNKIPDAVYSIVVRVLERPATLSLDADTFPLELEWKEPVVLRAAAKMWALKGDEARYTLTQTLFQESVGSVLERIQSIENRNDHDATMRADTHSMTVRNR